MFRIAFQRILVAPELASQFDAARLGASPLEVRLGRLEQAGLLAGRPVRDAASPHHALSEGLAEMELRGASRTGAGGDLAGRRPFVGRGLCRFATVAPAKSHRSGGATSAPNY